MLLLIGMPKPVLPYLEVLYTENVFYLSQKADDAYMSTCRDVLINPQLFRERKEKLNRIAQDID